MLTKFLEKRMHPSEQNPDRWWINFLGGPQTSSGAQVNEETALSWTAFGSGVRFTGEVMGSIPLGIYRRIERGKELSTGHYLYPLLHDAPNDEITSFEWRELIASHLIGWGNHYSQVVNNRRGETLSIWPLNPDRVKPFRGSDGLMYYRVTVPRSSIGGAAEARILRSDEVLHIRGFTPDGMFGRALTSMHREAIGLGLATEEFAARFFGSGASPSGILTHPQVLSEQAKKRLEESFAKQYAGLSQAHRTLLLEEGMQWKQVTVDPEKAQFLGLRQFQVVEAARILRLPPHVLYSLERATWNNVEQMGIDLVVYSLRPHAVRWEQRMRLDLLGRKDRNNYLIEFNLDGLLRGDSAARAAFYQSLFNMAAISPNEIREKENMNPYDGGDDRYIGLNLINVGAPPEPQMNREMRAIERRASPIRRKRLRASHVRIFRQAAARLTADEVAAVREAKGRLLQRDDADFLAWLETFYRDEYPKLIERHVLPPQVSYALVMAQTAAEEVGADFDQDQIERLVRDYHERYVNRRVGSSLTQLTDLVNETEADQLDAAIEGRLDEWTAKNPDKLGWSDAVTLGGAVATTVMVSAGVTRFRWNSLGDSCPFCTQLDGKIVGVQEAFLAEGQSLEAEGKEPLVAGGNVFHEPAHGGCDCIVTAE